MPTNDIRIKRLYDTMARHYNMTEPFEDFTDKFTGSEQARRKVYDAMARHYNMTESFEDFSKIATDGSFSGSQTRLNSSDDKNQKQKITQENASNYYQIGSNDKHTDKVYKETEAKEENKPASVGATGPAKRDPVLLAEEDFKRSKDSLLSGLIPSGDENFYTKLSEKEREVYWQRYQELEDNYKREKKTSKEWAKANTWIKDELKEQRKEERKDKLKNLGKGLIRSIAYPAGTATGSVSYKLTAGDTPAQAQAKEWAEPYMKEYRESKAVARVLDESVKLFNAAEKGKGVGRGIIDDMAKIQTWDLGLSDMSHQMTLGTLYEKEERGEPLTATENEVLDAVAIASYVTEQVSPAVKRGYNVGTSLPQSLGFMFSLYINPASGLGKTIASRAIRRYGRRGVSKLTTRAIGTGARVVGDIAEMGIATATSGSGRVLAEAIERVNGSPTYEISPEGFVVYGGQRDKEEFGRAYAKAFGSNYIENWSEAVGDYFLPLIKPLDTTLKNIIDVKLRKKNLNGIADFLNSVPKSQLAGMVNDFKERTKFSGLIGEILEEEIGMLIEPLLIGDTTLKENFGVWSKDPQIRETARDNQLTTIFSCALMSGALGAVQVAGGRVAAKMDKDVRKAHQEGQRLFKKDWTDIKDRIDEAEPDQVVSITKDIAFNPNLSVEQRKAVVEYAYKRMINQQYNTTAKLTRDEMTQTAQTLLTAYDAGYRMATASHPKGIRKAYIEAIEAAEVLQQYDKKYHTDLFSTAEKLLTADMATRQMTLDGLGREQSELVEDYLAKTLRQTGIEDGTTDDVQDTVEAALSALDPVTTHDEQGNPVIISALTADDRVVYITGEQDKMSTVTYEDTYETTVYPTDQLKDHVVQSKEDVINEFEAQIRERSRARLTHYSQHNDKTQPIQKGLVIGDGDAKVIVTDTGAGWATIQEAETDKESGQIVPKKDAPTRDVTHDYLLSLQDDIYDHRDMMDGMNQMAQMVAQEIKQAQQDTGVAPSDQEALRSRIAEWEVRTGVKAIIATTIDEVTSKSAQKAITEGRIVNAWYEVKTDRVGFYLPYIASVKEIDTGYMHEVVSHKGLRELLGQEKFDALMDAVWRDLMTEEDRAYYLHYNRHLNLEGADAQRAAADEYVARVAESVDATEPMSNITEAWNKIVEYVRGILEELGLVDNTLTNDELSDIIKASLLNYEHKQLQARQLSEQQAQAQAEQQAKAQEQAGEEALSKIPPIQNKQGETIDYDWAKAPDIETALTAMRHLGYTNQDIVQFALTYIDTLVGRHNKLKKRTPKSLPEQKAKRENIQAITQELSFWRGVRDQIQKETTPEIESRPREEQEQTNIEGIAKRFNEGKRTRGIETTVILADGTEISGHYELTEAGDVTASHNPETFKQSEGFPTNENGSTVNDRDYQHDKAAQEAVKLKGQSYDKRAYQEPVIVSPDGVVYSGNDRTMAGIIAANNGADVKYNESLRQDIAQYGFTEEQFNEYKHPRLVFVTAETLPYTTETFARFNASERKSQDSTEKMVKSGKTTSDVTFQRLSDLTQGYDDVFEMYNKGGAEIINLLIKEGVITSNDAAQHLDGDKLSRTGQEFVESLIMGYLFNQNDQTVRMLFADGMGNVRKSIIGSLSQLIVNRTMGEYSIQPEMEQAIEICYRAHRAHKGSVEGFLSQINLFTNDVNSKESSELAQQIALSINTGSVRLRGALDVYNKSFANDVGAVAGVFGKITRDEALQDLTNYLKRYDTEEKTGDVPEGITGDRRDDIGSSDQSGADDRGAAETTQRRTDTDSPADNEESRGEQVSGVEAEEETLFRVPSDNQQIFDAAKEKFGTTLDMREAGYILPDGSMLDFSGKHEVRGADTSFLNGERSVDHREISDIAYDFDGESTGVKTDMADFLDRGAIRIDYDAGAINLNVAPTKEQKDRLRRLIERNRGDVYIDFGKGWDTEHYVEYEGARASRVLADIDRYYSEGIKPEGTVMFREQAEAYERQLSDITEKARIDIAREYNRYQGTQVNMLTKDVYEASNGMTVIPKHVGNYKDVSVEVGGIELTRKSGGEERRKAIREYRDYIESNILPYSEWLSANMENIGPILEKHGITESDLIASIEDNVRFRTVDESGFYSTVESALEGIKQNKGTPQQFKAMLLKNGAKQAELDGMGWDDQFPDATKKVSKEKQLDIIQSTNPMRDDIHVGIRKLEDIKTFDQVVDDPESFVYGDFSKEDAQKALKEGSVTVYSSTPIKNGAFVSTSEKQAKDYAGNGKVYSQKVSLSDVAWINGDEGQMAKADNTITKAEIQDWIDQNRIQVEEVEKGGFEWKGNDLIVGGEVVASLIHNEDGTWSYQSDFSEDEEAWETKFDAQKEAEEAIIGDPYSPDATRYSQYTLPGGENYKELLLTMPVKGKTITVAEKEELENLQRRQNNEVNFPENDLDRLKELMQKSRDSFDNKEQFKSPHFEEPNILAHVRFDERTVNGERVLFIEEIQSDWAQEGKKKGFKQPNVELRLLLTTEELDITQSEHQYHTQIDGKTYNVGKGVVGSEEAAKQYFVDWLNKEIIKSNDRIQKKNRYATPDMPFKKTDQWVNLALRRMMMYAAENGYDRIAWTTGEQQADRYDLSKQIDRVEYDVKPGIFPGVKAYTLDVFDKNGTPVMREHGLDEEAIEERIGKELANKIANGEGQAKGDKKVLSGLDLKVGGEGMKAFYDQIVPKAAKKLAKPFGAQVETINIKNKTFNIRRKNNGYFEVSDIDGNMVMNNVDPANIDQWKQSDIYVQSIPITDELREMVPEGMPLFRVIGEIGVSRLDGAEKILDNLRVAKQMEIRPDISLNEIKLATGWERGADRKWRYEQPDGKPITENLYSPEDGVMTTHESDEDAADIANAPKLSEVWDDAELFKTYPKIADIKVIGIYGHVVDKPSGIYGTEKGVKVINAVAPDADAWRMVMVHEIQHAIQDIEGFARGGDHSIIERGLVSVRDKQTAETLNPYTAYHLLAGEVEARNVSRRRDFTAEERRRMLLEDSEDVERSQQIVLRGVAEDTMFREADISGEKFGDSDKTATFVEENSKGHGTGEAIQQTLQFKGEGATYTDTAADDIQRKGGAEPDTRNIRTQAGAGALIRPLRKLKKGEICFVQRKMSEDKNFSFTGANQIESTEDVAYIFKQLENKAVENAFLVFIKDGKATVLHVGMGNLSGTTFDTVPIAVMLSNIKPDTVYMVHNHPSGNVVASDQDHKTYNDITRIVKTHSPKTTLGEGIIIDTKSGIYGIFGKSATEKKEAVKKPLYETNIPVYKFDELAFSKDYDPLKLTRIKNSLDIANFVATHRLGERDKVNILCTNTSGHVVGNFFTDITTLKSDKDAERLARLCAEYVGMTGARSVAVFGSGVAPASTAKGAELKYWNNFRYAARNMQVSLLGIISVDNLYGTHSSYADNDLMETTAAYGEQEREESTEVEDVRFNETRRERKERLESDWELLKKEQGLAVATYDRRLANTAVKVYEATTDNCRSVKELQKAVTAETGKTLKSYENVYWLKLDETSRTQPAQWNFARFFYEPLTDEVRRIIQSNTTGIVGYRKAYKELSEYLMAKHGLERNDKFAMRDAQKAFEAYEKAHPNTGKTVEDFYADFRKRDYSGLTALTDKKETEDAEAMAQAMVEAYESANDTKELWRLINRSTKEILRISYNGSMISKQTYIDLVTMFDYYIPLRGFDETTSDEVYSYVGTVNSPYNTAIKSARGRRSRAEDPLATIGNMADSEIINAHKNVAKRALLSLAENHRTNLLSVSEVMYVKDANTGNWVMSMPLFDDGDTAEEVTAKMIEHRHWFAAQMMIDPDNYKMGTDAINIPYKVVSSKALSEHQVLVTRGGQKYIVTINGNPRAAQAINGKLNPYAYYSALSPIRAVNRFMAKMFTQYNPEFVFSNLTRDGHYANTMVWVRENRDYAEDYNKNWVVSFKDTPRLLHKYKNGTLDTSVPIERYYKEFIEHGGETGYTRLLSVTDYKKQMERKLRGASRYSPLEVANKVVGGYLDTIEDLNRWAEGVSRFAAFLTSRVHGRDIIRSVNDAKEITVNFNRKGAGTALMKAGEKNAAAITAALVAQFGREGYVFFNASIQALDNYAKAGKKNPGKFTSLVIGNIMTGFVMAMLYGDDDDYLNLPPYVRRNNLCAKVDGKWVTIPLSHEHRGFFGLGELAYMVMSGREFYDDNELMTEILSQFSQMLPVDFLESNEADLVMTMMPTAVRPAVEAYVNKDWTGSPIYSDSPYNEHDPEWRKAFRYTSPTLVSATRKLSDATGGSVGRGGSINLNPAIIEHLFESYLGGVGTAFNEAYKTVRAIAGDKQMQEIRNVPVVSRFVRQTDGQAAARAENSRYYDVRDYVEGITNEERRLRQMAAEKEITGLDYDADDIAATIQKLQELRASNKWAFVQQWKALDKARRAAQEAGEEEQMYNITKQANDLYKELRRSKMEDKPVGTTK